MIYKFAALMCMTIFYGFYFSKLIRQKRRGIRTNQMAKGSERDKSFYVELLLKLATYILPAIEVLSIIFVHSGIVQRLFGLYFAILGDIIFAIAIISMRDSWRAGIAKDDDEGRSLVTEGIYRYSRNPAFLGFDLVYIGILIMYFNPVLMIFTLFSLVMMHLQILNEEAFLEGAYGKEYVEYKKGTSRYAGLGNVTYSKLVLYVYCLLFIWSVFYFVTCLFYGGPRLSMIWIWVLLGIFAAIRIKMLTMVIAGRLKIHIFVKLVYRLLFLIGLCGFILIEGNVVAGMTSVGKDNLDYVVVLGAGIRGSIPTNPLRQRIQKAYEYMSENESTILIASGGQGPDEDLSEALCIKQMLVDKGIAADRIILEDKSTSTVENLKNSFEIINDKEASVGIITSGFHEYRANLIAKNVGFCNVSSIPAITLFPLGIHFSVREFFGVFEYLVYVFRQKVI